MTPSVALLRQSPVACSNNYTTLDDGPSPKRRRVSLDDSEASVRHYTPREGNTEDEGQQNSLTGIPRHPLGVRPLGNLYAAKEPNIKARCGVLAFVPDELLLQIFETLEASHLLGLGSTCKALYALTRSDELWRALFIAYVLFLKT